MGQIIFKDKIGALSQVGGNILMAASVGTPAYLTIGGQQYTITTQLSVAIPTLLANTRYQIFAVQSAGVVSLSISINENSVGPTGAAGWKLVGAFQADGTGSPAFGSFFNITGRPKTLSLVTMGPSTITGHVSPPTKGVTSVDRIGYYIDGNITRYHFEYTQTAATGAALGSGFYLIQLAFAADTTLVPPNTTNNANLPGIGLLPGTLSGTNHTVTALYVPLLHDTNRIQFNGKGNAADDGWGSFTFGLTSALLDMYAWFDVPTVGFTDTPIEDR